MFAVGDPMQSIYRFREAEVGLFLRAWERGIGPLALQPLKLTRNFRSQQGVVDWVNDAFARRHNLRPGQWIHLVLNNRRQELFIVGTAISSEFVYLLGVRPAP